MSLFFGSSGSKRVLRRTLLASLLAVLAASLSLQGAVGQTYQAQNDGMIDDIYHRGLPDLDARGASTAPTAAQQDLASRLGATVRWNRYGTPGSIINYGGYIATGLQGTAVQASRSWIRANRGLFRLTDADVTNLELLNDSAIIDTPGHAVLFRQRFGGLSSTHDAMITVGISQGKIAYVSSSIAGHRPAPEPATISATQAWLQAAANIGRAAPASAVSNLRQENGWTVFSVEGFATPVVQQEKKGHIDQRARLVAIPTYDGGVRSAYETVVLDMTNGTLGYTSFVDARTGQVLVRVNRVQQFALGMPRSDFFTGSTPANGLCGPQHVVPVDADNRTIDAAATANVPANDIIIQILDPQNNVVASGDTLFSPEAVHYDLPGGPQQVGDWAVRVCEFEEGGTFDYTGFWATTDVAIPQPFPYPPRWRWFLANPELGASHPNPDGWPYPDDDTRTKGCWDTKDAKGAPVPADQCDFVVDQEGSPAPWDHIIQTNTPSFTTIGNNAETAEAWFAALTPGPTSKRPMDPDRTYGYEDNPLENFTDEWNNEKCNPAALATPQQNDVLAAVTNLFSGHNRVHDYSYHLGFTEQNYNMQMNNFGNTAPGPFPNGREGDPEIGNVQNGAAIPAAVGLTRDNANQITLNDGIPGITNQFLFQPVAGAIYVPCVDGDFDSSVYVHEYTHAISNRMVAGPDTGLSGHQAGSMGESWSDLVAVEYLNSYGYVPTNDENPWAVGAYATGNHEKGIRDYAINDNPLNYSDIGFDMVGPEVHADGEVWNAVNYDLRQALVRKYNSQYPASNLSLQKRCNDGILPADKCPGNRRWIQTVFDAFLLTGPGPSMLDSRDAYLAADLLRYGGSLPGDINQKELWREFARNGMGQFASSAGSDDTDPIPSFESKVESNEATLTFTDAIAADQTGTPHVNATIYVGDYEARITPVADTDPATPLKNVLKLVPGTYNFIARAEGYGMLKFTHTLRAGMARNLVIRFSTNLASTHQGATATGDGANHEQLIDDTESTTWEATGQAPNVSVTNPQVTVDLAGDAHVVRTVNVSALLTPGQGRFSALRQFQIQTCNEELGSCALPTDFNTIYTSPADAFPAEAIRPLAPDLILRTFNVPDTEATHVRLVVLHNQCTGEDDYQGDQENDPLTPTTDCSEGSPRATEVRAAELQVFGSGAVVRAPGDPVVAVTMTGPAVASRGEKLRYEITYTNVGPADALKARVLDSLPRELAFVSASRGGTYIADTRSVIWRLGTVPRGATGKLTLVAKVRDNVSKGTVILNQATFDAHLTYAVPAAVVTVVT